MTGEHEAGGAGDQRQGGGLGLDCFRIDDPAIVFDEQLDRDAAQRKPLAA